MSRPRAQRESGQFEPQKAMQKILDTIYLHRSKEYRRLSPHADGSDRLLSRLFQELPDQKDYADYYQIIKNPMALDNIQVWLCFPPF
jgi:Bromodomain